MHTRVTFSLRGALYRGSYSIFCIILITKQLDRLNVERQLNQRGQSEFPWVLKTPSAETMGLCLFVSSLCFFFSFLFYFAFEWVRHESRGSLPVWKGCLWSVLTVVRLIMRPPPVPRTQIDRGLITRPEPNGYTIGPHICTYIIPISANSRTG